MSASNSAGVQWADFWCMISSMSAETKQSLAEQIDLPNWLSTRSPMVVCEVLEQAPKDVLVFFWPSLSLPAKKLILKKHGYEVKDRPGARLADRMGQYQLR